MRLNLFLKSFAYTVIILFIIIFLFEVFVNQDNKNYISTFDRISADEIKTNSDDFVVAIISVNCPGKSTFMPQVKAIENILLSANISFFIVNDSPNDKSHEIALQNMIDEFQITSKVYQIDYNIYKTNGGLINAKRRYYDFALDLYSSLTELYLGYGYYIVFSDGKFQFDTYNHNEVLDFFNSKY
ncbi:MAG: hypothetical protein KIT33_02095 [Candidatus Kapabacteria bacterium]|nr:hypothetical protein [Ignavibacteriota bacterium]MCW5883743.1 hypothetical protein [Candidatus Kapabacteria bacterium]